MKTHGERWAVALAVLLALAATLVVMVANERTSAPAQAAPVPGELLPNLRSLPPPHLRADLTPQGREVRFPGLLANTGPGPLELRPVRDQGCNGQDPASSLTALQVLATDVDGDGRYAADRDRLGSERVAGCMIDHPAHGHWHFEALARYELTRTDGTPVTSSDKVSFCLIDSRPIPSGPGAALQPAPQDCEREGRQRISVGWADVYRASLEGQSLALAPELDDGDYCLRHTADPLNLLREADETDNVTSVTVAVRGAAAQLGDPGVCH